MKLDKNRRIKNKTNYRKRLTLLKSNAIRFVVRKTNKYVTMQLIESKDAQDKIIASINTKQLLEHGWPKEKLGSLKSLSASYLAGYLLGHKAKIKERVILDSGLIPSTKGSRTYAAVKGLADAGIDIAFDEKIVPNEKQIKHVIGENIFNKIKGGLK